MKLFLFLLIVPFVSFATETKVESPKELNQFTTNTLGADLHIAGNVVATKTTPLSTGEFLYDIKFTALGDVKIADAHAISYNGSVKSVMVKFNKANGTKYLNSLLKKYGMPTGDVADNFEWTINNITFEVHETSAGYEASYKSTL